ncbi:MAG: hypothetical protein U1E60_24070 [Reyranellaceae bacterium]
MTHRVAVVRAGPAGFLNRHEVAAGVPLGRPRVKLTAWPALLAVAQGD